MLTNPIDAWLIQWQAHPLFQGLTPEQLNYLGNLTMTRLYRPGEEIVREGETSDELYFITTGEVALLKDDESKQAQYQIGTLSSGATFGEIAFINAAPRTATVKALTDVQILLLKRSALEEAGVETKSLLNRLDANIAHLLAGTLQNRTEAYVQNLQAQLAGLRMMNEFGQLFVGTVACFAVGTFMNLLFSAYMRLDSPFWPLALWGYLLLVLLPITYLIWKSARPLADFGITLANWRRVVSEALLLSGLLMGVALLILWGYGAMTGQPLLAFIDKDISLLATILYLPHSYIQELIGRGVIQNSLQRFFRDTRGSRTILVAAAIFAMFHSHLGLAVVILTFFSGVFFGYIFLRQQNLIGVAIVHWLLGTLTFALKML